MEPFASRWNEQERTDALNLLLALDYLLNKLKIPHTLICGSLLGAIRHDGLIPWDDDIDITVPISDWNNLLSFRPLFESAGMVIDKPTTDKTIKVYVKDKPFPFIDIFRDARIDENTIRSFGHMDKYYVDVPITSWYPFHLHKFESIQWYVPATPEAFLDGKYPQWKTIAFTGTYNHKTSKKREGDMIASADWEELKCSLECASADTI